MSDSNEQIAYALMERHLKMLPIDKLEEKCTDLDKLIALYRKCLDAVYSRQGKS